MKDREGAEVGELIRWPEEANGDLKQPLNSTMSDSGDFNVPQQRRRSSKWEATLLSTGASRVKKKRKCTSKNIKPVQHINLRESFWLLTYFLLCHTVILLQFSTCSWKIKS